jgi:hypothetical protein
MKAPDKFINDLFKGTNFGEAINGSVKEKRRLIAKKLNYQANGKTAFWIGHTLYHILVNGGFMLDGKKGERKRLTTLGNSFLLEESNLLK